MGAYPAEIDRWVQQAVAGDRHALTQVLEAIHGPVYNLALRMLRSPADAEDAAQDILIRVMTHLSAFRSESAFTTWVYRIATNYLLTALDKNTRTPQAAFEELGALLDRSLAHTTPDPAEVLDEALLTTEVRRSCTLGMLHCLDRDQRMAIVLGELFEMSSDEAAAILGISPAAFRKRLSRARAALVAFVSHRCGIVNPASPCRCNKHIRNKIQAGLLDPNHLQYATTSDSHSQHEFLRAQREELSLMCRTSALLRAHPAYVPAGRVHEWVEALVQNPESRLFEDDA